MTDVIASEWHKLRSVQSSVLVVFAVAAVAALSALVAWQMVGAWEAATPQRRASLADFHPEEGLLMLVQLCVAALGVLAITAEYATGMIRTSLTAVPQRGRLLAAKAVVVGAAALALGQAAVFAMFFLSRLVIGDRPIGLYAPLAEEAPRLASLGLSVMVVALLGLGFGTVTRSTAGALTAVVALLFILPALGRLLPQPWDDRVFAVTLSQLPQQLAGAPDAYLSPLGALAAMAAYAAAVLTAAAVTLSRRDA